MIDHGNFYTLFDTNHAEESEGFTKWCAILNSNVREYTSREGYKAHVATIENRVGLVPAGHHILFIDHLRVVIEDNCLHPYRRLFDVTIGDRRVVAIAIPDEDVVKVEYALDRAKHHTPINVSMEKEYLHLNLQLWWEDHKEELEAEQITRQKDWLAQQLAK